MPRPEIEAIRARVRQRAEMMPTSTWSAEDIAALLAYIAELEPIARAVASLPLDSCACWVDDPEATEHAADCWIARARAIIAPPAESEASE